MNYVDRLSKAGDPTEIRGVNIYKLGQKFPRYAEFWEKYVYPNRHPQNDDKLRDGFPAQIEEIFNAHYSIFYQLTHAYSQIEYLSSVETSELLDTPNPFYHLATAIDLIETTFVATFHVADSSLIQELSEEEFNKCTNIYWKKGRYKKAYTEFKETLKPASLYFHDLKSLFSKIVPKDDNRTTFLYTAEQIRAYRNKLIHGRSPLRILVDGKIHFPKYDYLKKATNGHWSSMRDEIKIDEYEPAIELMTRLADALVKSTNDLWALLITTIEAHVPMPDNTFKFQDLSKLEPD